MKEAPALKLREEAAKKAAEDMEANLRKKGCGVECNEQ